MWFPHLILLLALYTFGPGMLLVRPLRLAPGERLCAAVGAGLFLDYLLSFAIFANGLNPVAHLLVSVAGGVMLLASWRDWLAVLRSHQVRRMLVCWVCLLAWGLILIAMIRHYGGGTWGGDWQEHYERARFLQGGREYGFKFIEQYEFPMRPPMMNAVVAGLISQAVDYAPIFQNDLGYADYDAFQVAFVFLNSLVVLPCALLVGRVVKLPPRWARKATWTLAAVLAASPMFSQNLSYAWTKLFAGFYALLAIAIYLRAWRRAGEKSEVERLKAEAASSDATQLAVTSPSDFRLSTSDLRFPLAFALLCVGFLVHFSVGPYALFLGLHYLLAVWWRRPRRWAEAGVIGGASVAVLACWFSWSIYHYGAKTTFTSTSAVSDSAKMTGSENATNIAKNVGNTLLPTILRTPPSTLQFVGPGPGVPDAPPTAPAVHPPAATAVVGPADDRDPVRLDLEQLGLAGQIRDYTFLIYQVSLPGGLGFVGFGLTLVLLWRAHKGRTPTVPSVRRFWLAFVPVVFVVGTAVYGGTDRFGVAHICLQPLILCGLCLVAGGVWTLPAWARYVLLSGLVLDFALGVLLQATLEHRLFQIETVSAGGANPGFGYRVVIGPDVPSRAAQNNLGNKLAGRFTFWGDHFADKDGDLLPLLQALLVGLMTFLLVKGLRLSKVPPAAARAGSGTDGGGGYDPRRAGASATPGAIATTARQPSRKRSRGRR